LKFCAFSTVNYEIDVDSRQIVVKYLSPTSEEAKVLRKDQTENKFLGGGGGWEIK
jgi:hypothetical protein